MSTEKKPRKPRTIDVKAIRNTTFAKLGETKTVVRSKRIEDLIEAGYLEEVKDEAAPESTSEEEADGD